MPSIGLSITSLAFVLGMIDENVTVWHLKETKKDTKLDIKYGTIHITLRCLINGGGGGGVGDLC